MDTHKVYVFSRGKFESLGNDFLENKAIVRIHNLSDRDWYPLSEAGRFVAFFNDIRRSQLRISERITLKLPLDMPGEHFTKMMAREMLGYLMGNIGREFVIHCQYGRSRSVAVAKFLVEAYGYKVCNKSEEEMVNGNDLVLELLKTMHSKCSP